MRRSSASHRNAPKSARNAAPDVHPHPPDPMQPAFPSERPTTFRTTVHGTVFGRRASHVEEIEAGSALLLIPDPPTEEEPAVWVHLAGGDPVGHLPPEISLWLAPWLLRGGRATATAVRVGGDGVPSWKRLLIEVQLEGDGGRAGS
jgi:hypothetical protein